MPLTLSPIQEGFKDKIKKSLLSNAYHFFKTTAGGSLLNVIFSKADFILPIKRIWDTEALLALPHQLPAYPLHILLVPKRAYANLDKLISEDHELLSEMLQAVQYLVKTLELFQTDYWVIVNGGSAQDINHLHGHLIGNFHD